MRHHPGYDKRGGLKKRWGKNKKMGVITKPAESKVLISEKRGPLFTIKGSQRSGGLSWACRTVFLKRMGKRDMG